MSVVAKEHSGQCIEIDRNRTVVLINYPDQAFLRGILNVKALRGSVRIFGYDLSPSTSPALAYSLEHFNTLPVVPVDDPQTEEDMLYLRSLRIPTDTIEKVVRKALNYSHVFLVTRSDDADSFVSFFVNADLPVCTRTTVDSPMVDFGDSGIEHPLVENSQWDDLAVKFMSKNRKIIICGGKGVGKSTFLRYLVNRFLRQWPRVLIIDCDPGQCEFTVMSCLSAVLIEQPLLGPNFTHITTPIRCIHLGDINAGSCSALYVESIEKLVSFCDCGRYEDVPWIINTMGFVKDLGIPLLARIMETTMPTDIVQIKSKKQANNFAGHLTPAFFGLEKLKRNETQYWKPRLHILSSMAESVPCGAQLRPAVTRRDIFTMSYLRKALEGSESDLLSITPKKISIDDVQIEIAKPTSIDISMTMTTVQKLNCINANLIALCSGKDLNQLDCSGFGVVRGFDLDTNMIYLITPLSDEALKRVTVIKMSSSVQLPQALYTSHMSQTNNSYPYFNYRIPDKLSQPIRKTTGRLRFGQDPKGDSGYHDAD